MLKQKLPSERKDEKKRGVNVAVSSLSPQWLLSVWLSVSYLVAVYEVEDQVYVSVHRLVLGQLRLHSVQPVDQRLQGVSELSREQQRLLQLVLPERERKTQSTAANCGIGGSEGGR